jgi:DNA-binding NtrC family response regulator
MRPVNPKKTEIHGGKMDPKTHKILIVDDDPEIVWYISSLVKKFGYDFESASNGEACLSKIEKTAFDMVILDITMPGMSGVDVMKQMNERGFKAPVIILSAYENVSFAVETTKLGAYDYLVKPVDEEKFRVTVQNALKTRELETEIKLLRKKIKGEDSEEEIITGHPGFSKVVETARKIAGYEVSVLLLGESGTGKELVAKTIHRNSQRKEGLFVSIDCATLPDNLVESELFGHEKGSFTGATEAKTGRFELANGGSLFLDEIGNLSLNVQKKLLRVLQERKIVRIGGRKTIDLDIRVITATNVDLNEAVKKGEFRDDLFHRINEYYLELPPLRGRGDDVLLLAGRFIMKYNLKFEKNVKEIDDEVKQIFMDYSWPGNVRELENTIKHAIIMADTYITKANLPKSLTDRVAGGEHYGQPGMEGGAGGSDSGEILPLKDACGRAREQIEREMIVRALNKFKWNKTKVSEALKVDYKTLYNKMKEYGL